MPYVTIEAILPLTGDRVAIVNDTNFGSTGRNPGLPDYSDFIVVSVPGLRDGQALVARAPGAIISPTAMFVGLVDTRKPEPEPEEEREPLLERIPELRPWRWYVADRSCAWSASGYGAGLADARPRRPSACARFFHALTSYYKGNDGLSQYRQ